MLERSDLEPLFFAPFVSSIMRVEPTWIDYNGHLNMAYYNVLFDRAVDEAYELLGIGLDYVKQRQAFGHKIIDFQNTQFVLAECKSEATIAKVFLDHCIERHVKGELDTVTASMAKYWHTDLVGTIVDRCLQLFGGYGYMDEYPISRLYRDARVMRIYAGTNEIMKLLIARSL